MPKLDSKTVKKAAISSKKKLISDINKELSSIAKYTGEFSEDRRNEKGLLPSSKLTAKQKKNRSDLSTIKSLKGSLVQPSADMVAITRRAIRLLKGKQTKGSLVQERKRLDTLLKRATQVKK